MSPRPVRVMKHPTGYWFWICRVGRDTGGVDLWCITESHAFEYATHAAAMKGAEAHLARHDATGYLTLTVEAILAAT